MKIKSIKTLLFAAGAFSLVSCANVKEQPSATETFDTPVGFDTQKSNVAYGKVQQLSYYSSTTEDYRNVNIILPHGYDSLKTYPVLYLLHGIGGDENEWFGGAPNEIISNLVADGKVSEMVVVIPNVRARHKSVVEAPEFFSVEHFGEFNNFLNDLRDNLMPYVEANYSVKSGRENRAVAGLSMGGRAALHVGISLIDDFAYIGALTPAVGILPYHMEEGLFTTETLTLPEQYKPNTLVMIQKGSTDTVVEHWPETYSATLTANGVDHIYFVTEGGHEFNVWRNGLYNFARRIFQEVK